MRRLAVYLFTLGMLLSGCDYQISSPMRTEIPLYIAPAAKTATLPPTPTMDLTAAIQLGEEIVRPDGGYAFKPLTRASQNGPVFELSFDQNQDETESVRISTAETGLSFFIRLLPRNGIANDSACFQLASETVFPECESCQTGEPKPITLPIGQALQAELSGSGSDFKIAGEIMTVFSENGCLSLVGSATSQVSDEQALWQNLGKPAFDQMADSLRFLETQAAQPCPPSPRGSYGFSADDPIAVGNVDLYDGREREELYLLTLRGPNGEEVFFERQRPLFNQNNEIVDPYKIRYDGKEDPVILYFTIYRFEDLTNAPVGFTCEAAFPLDDPNP